MSAKITTSQHSKEKKDNNGHPNKSEAGQKQYQVTKRLNLMAREEVPKIHSKLIADSYIQS